MDKMHPKFRTVFEEHRNPKHCCRTRTFEKTKQLGVLAAQLQAQMTAYRELLMDLETEADLDDAYRQKIEWMMQPVKAGERIAKNLSQAVRDATGIMVQIDRCFAQAALDVEETATRKGGVLPIPTLGAGPTV